MKYLRKFASEADYNAAETLPTKNYVSLVGINVMYDKGMPEGVYIQHINGKLYTTDEWTAEGFANDNANGVAIISGDVAFIIAKEDASSSTLCWGGNTNRIVGVLTSSKSSVALTDVDGAGNTQKIIEQLSGYTDVNGTVGAPAAEACANYTFPNGKKGYLPALGELQTAFNNKGAVASAMSLIGGKALQADSYWSSSQAGSGNSWQCYWDNGYVSAMSKGNGYNVRAFSKL